MYLQDSSTLARASDTILPAGDVFDGLPLHHFACVYIDPPWAYQIRSDKGLGRSAERHYSTMSLEGICELPVAEVCAKDSFCFLWITAPFLAQGHHVRVLEAWGFKPSSIAFAWVKTNSAERLAKAETWDEVMFSGMGFTTRQNLEVVVLGRRGSPKRLDRSIRQVVVAPLLRHSEKPEEVARRIERFCDGPRLEVFARKTRPGWTSIGDEVGKLDAVA
jgi:N6-adenosine-specific RNA methylase IME4